MPLTFGEDKIMPKLTGSAKYSYPTDPKDISNFPFPEKMGKIEEMQIEYKVSLMPDIIRNSYILVFYMPKFILEFDVTGITYNKNMDNPEINDAINQCEKIIIEKYPELLERLK